MIYICEVCGFLFWRSRPQTECPFCGTSRICEATAEEEILFRQMLDCRDKSICGYSSRNDEGEN